MHSDRFNVSGSGTTQIIVPIIEGSNAADTSVGSFTVASAAGAASDSAANASVAFAATAPTDTAGPVATAKSFINVGGTGGKAEAGDTITITFTELLAALASTSSR